MLSLFEIFRQGRPEEQMYATDICYVFAKGIPASGQIGKQSGKKDNKLSSQ